MAYVSQEDKRTVATRIKPILDKYGVKATLSVRNHSALVLTIRSGAIDFAADALPDWRTGEDTTAKLREWGHWSFGRLDNYVTGSISYRFFDEILPALKVPGWFDNSDITTDFFHVRYYIDVKIGQWDKHYVYNGTPATVEV